MKSTEPIFIRGGDFFVCYLLPTGKSILGKLWQCYRCNFFVRLYYLKPIV